MDVKNNMQTLDTEKMLKDRMQYIAEQLVKCSIESKQVLDMMYSEQTEVPTVDLVKMWFIYDRKLETMFQHLRDMARGQTPF